MIFIYLVVSVATLELIFKEEDPYYRFREIG